MADKLITQLQQRSAVSADVNLVVDDGIQTYRVTAAQFREFLNPNPIGSGMDYFGTTLPDGYLWADGSAISRTTFADLFAKIGTTYGVGDGSTTFALPDKRGRASIAADNLGGSTAGRVTNAGSGITGTTLGAAGGVENVTLTSAQIPAHTHTFSGTTGNESANHTHDNAIFNNYSSVYGGYSGSNGSRGISNGVSGASTSGQSTSTQSANHTHSYSGTTAANTGGGSAHTNMQPSLVCNYIIKYR